MAGTARLRRFACLPIPLLLFLTAAAGSPAEHSAKTLARLDSLWQRNEREILWKELDLELADARGADDSVLVLELLVRKGATHAAIGQALQAKPVLLEALSLARSLGERRMECRCLRWLAVASAPLGERSEARQYWQSLCTLAQALGDRWHEAQGWTGLAYIDWLEGHAESSREKYQRALSILEGLGEPRHQFLALNGLGTALTSLGAYREALSCYERTAEIAKAGGRPGPQAIALNNIGTLHYALGDPGEARRHFEEAHRLQVLDGNLPEAAIAGSNLAFCDAALGRRTEALAFLASLSAQCEDQGIREPINLIRNHMAEILHEGGRSRLAAQVYRAILARSEPLSPSQEIEALTGLSSALAEIDSAGAAVELLQGKAAWAHRLEDPSLRLRFDLEMGRRALDVGRDREALELLVRSEAEAELLDHEMLRLNALVPAARAARAMQMPDSALALLDRAVSCWQSERGLPADPDWREVRGALAHELFCELGALLVAHPTTLPDSTRARKAFDSLQAFKARTLIERMLGPEERDASTLASRPVTCGELQNRVLRPDEILLDYYVGDRASILFAVTRKDCVAIPMPPSQDLLATIRLYHRILSAQERRAWLARQDSTFQRASGRVRDLLLGPADGMIQARRCLILVPDGEIGRIPFSPLLSTEEAGRRPDSSGGVLQVQVVPSASILAQLRLRPAPDPCETGRPASIAAIRGGSTGGAEGPLPGARDEVGLIVRRYAWATSSPPVERAPHAPAGALGASGSSAYLQAIRDYDILHFAGHSVADDQYPWRSSIRLEGPGPAPESFELHASEIARSRLAAQLVVLSSCRSAGGRVLAGEGIQGLASAFLSSGASAVVASLWPVEDRTTEALMARFYGGLARARTAGSALAEAQAAIRDDPATADPFYWAGFVLIGDGDVRSRLVTRKSLPPVLLPSLLGLAGLLALQGPRLLRAIVRRPV